MKELLSAFSYMGIYQVVSLVFGLARSKIIATFLGPFGMGIFSQANQLMELVRQVSSLGILDGFLKLVAEYKTHQDRIRLGKTIMTAISLFGALGLVLFLLSELFGQTLSVMVFDDPGYTWFIRIVIFTGVLSAEYYALMTIYQALLKWGEYALVSAISYAINLLIAVVLILTLQLLGAVLSMLAAQSVNVLLSVYVLRQRVLPRNFGRLWQQPGKQSFRELVRYIGPLSTLTLIAALTSMLIRSLIIHTFGAETNGIYAVIYAISLAYMGLVRNAFNAFGMPKITGVLNEPNKILRVQNDELRLGLLILCPLVLVIMLTRQVWIPLLYSREFLPAAPILIWQLVADVLRMIRISMNISLLPTDRLGFILVDGMVDWGGWLLLSVILLPVLGIMAIPMSYMVTAAVALLVSYAYHRRTTPFRIYRPNQTLLLKAFGLLLPGLMLAQWGQGILFQWVIPSMLVVLMLAWMPGRDEYQQLFDLVKKILLNIRGKI